MSRSVTFSPYIRYYRRNRRLLVLNRAARRVLEPRTQPPFVILVAVMVVSRFSCPFGLPMFECLRK
jgi:hypothetical protein